MRFYAQGLIVLLLAVSCGNPVTFGHPSSPLRGSITFPSDGAVFLEGTKVTFRCDAASPEVMWFQDGIPLASGFTYSTKMTPGLKEYRILIGDQVLDQIGVRVLPLGQQDKLVFNLSGPQGCVSLPAGDYLACLGSFSNSGETYKLEWPSFQTVAVVGAYSSGKPELLPNRPAWVPRIFAPTNGSDVHPRSILGSRHVHFPNLSGAGSSTDLEVALFAENERFELYTDANVDVYSASLHWLWEQLVERFLPRTEALWGSPGLASGSGKTTLIVTARINTDGSIIGFFNPADLFPQNLDPTSPDYNPGSNEGKFLYMGIPDELKANYTRASIAATAAHEYQHLIHFSRKTLALARLGNFDRFREAVFLDEGLSHLTESLIGLGASGGNLQFCSYYLKHTSDVSLLSVDRAGAADNAGIRGGVCLYLDWLFEENGGGRWDPSNPVVFQDGGGIAYLRTLIDSPWTGVENIEHLVGKPYSESLLEWANWINIRTTEQGIETDPWTDEPNRASPFLGEVLTSSGTIISLNGPIRIPLGQPLNILPYSLIFLSTFHLDAAKSLPYNGSTSVGPVYLSIFPQR